MSFFKEFEMELWDELNYSPMYDDDLDEDYVEFRLTLAIAEQQKTKIDSDSSTFFDDLYGQKSSDESVFIMCSDSHTNVRNFMIDNLLTFNQVISQFRSAYVNTFFSPCRYRKVGKKKKLRRADAFVSSTQCLFVDIDGLPYDFTAFTTDEIVSFLQDTYRLKTLPSWVVASGHGLHLYYILEEELIFPNQQCVWDSYIRSMILFFGADVSCKNRSRILRCPRSYNIKNVDDIRFTKLHHLVDDPYPLSDLRFFIDASTDDEYIVYEKGCYAERAEKGRATRAKNKLKKIEAGEKILARCKNPKKVSLKNGKKVKVKAKAISRSDELYKLSLRLNTYPIPASARYTKQLRDLENWAVWRGGVPLGYRSTFSHIYTMISKRSGRKEDDTFKKLFRFFDENFEHEARAIVKSVYASKITYMYRNSTIAERLSFSEDFLTHTYCCYTDDQVAQAKAKRNAKYYDKLDSVVDKRSVKQKNFVYISSHMTEKNAILANHLDLSLATIERMKAKVRKDAL